MVYDMDSGQNYCCMYDKINCLDLRKDPGQEFLKAVMEHQVALLIYLIYKLFSLAYFSFPFSSTLVVVKNIL